MRSCQKSFKKVGADVVNLRPFFTTQTQAIAERFYSLPCVTRVWWWSKSLSSQLGWRVRARNRRETKVYIILQMPGSRIDALESWFIHLFLALLTMHNLEWIHAAYIRDGYIQAIARVLYLQAYYYYLEFFIHVCFLSCVNAAFWWWFAPMSACLWASDGPAAKRP